MRIRSFAAVLTLASLAACSGGGCGNCKVPAYDPAPAKIPGVVPTTPPPGAVPSPGVSATPTPGVVLPPTVTPPAPTPSPLAALSCSQGAASIALGPALAPFAILAGSTVTNVGATVVTFAVGATTNGVDDDLIGVAPGTAVTGFYPPGVDLDGPSAIYAAGYNPNAAVPLAAQAALTAAYNTAAGKAPTAVFPGGQDLSQVSVPGHQTGTLPPGVYKSASSMAIATGNLTLDGGGNPQSVFIFQAGTTLTTTLNGGASGNVILTNGASACNVYWQVGTSATLGGATFFGDVMALASITVNAPTFTGRALASAGAVSIPVASGSLITNPGGS